MLDTAGRVRRSIEIQVHGSPMMHDFALTEKYVVILDLPVTFAALTGVTPQWQVDGTSLAPTLRGDDHRRPLRA